MESLPQKKIVVLGGSRGVGRVIVETLNAGGAQVLAVARNTDALTTLHRRARSGGRLWTDEAERAGDLRGRKAEARATRGGNLVLGRQHRLSLLRNCLSLAGQRH